MKFWWTAIFFCSAVNIDAYAQSAHEVDVRPRPKTQKQVVRALEVASLAAENGMQKLSLRAVRDAFAGGPPIIVVPKAARMSGSFSRSRGQVFGTTLPKLKTSPTKSLNTLQTHLQQLSSLWKRRKFDPHLVYEALSSVVFPPGRPDEVFFYEQTLSSTTLQTAGQVMPFNAGQLLVEWTALANAEDDLHRRLTKIQTLQSGQIKASVLQCMLALESNDTPELRKQLAQLPVNLQNNSTGSDAEAAAQLVFPLLGRKDVSLETAAVAELVIDAIVVGKSSTKDYHVQPATSFLKLIAKTYREAGALDKVRETVAKLLNVNTLFNNRYSSGSNNYVQRLRQAQVNTAASIFLDAEMFADAIPLMAEYYELQSVTGRNLRSDYGVKLFRIVMSVGPKERYRLLHLLAFSKTGNINLSAAFVPRSIPPPIFAETLSSGKHQDPFALPTSGPLRDVVNTAALLAQTARESGNLDALREEVVGNTSSPPVGLDVLQYFTALESDHPEFDSLNNMLSERITSLELLTLDRKGTDVRLDTLHDYTIAVRGVEVPEIRGAAVQLLQAVCDASLLCGNEIVRVHAQQTLNHVKLQAAGVVPESFPASNLRHWHSASCDADSTHAAGSVTATWAAEDGYVKGLTAPQDGLLYFRYPLTGDFEVSAMISEGPWREGGFVYDGMLTQNQSKKNEALLLHIGRSNRKSPRVSLTNTAAQAGLNSLQVHADTATYRINRHVASVDQISGSSPFFALKNSVAATPGFWNLKFTGNPQIPSEVRLLSDHRLRGWAPYYSAEKVCSAFETKDPAKGSWVVANGVLLAPERSTAPSTESLLTYQRPLQDGEKVTWEFEYEPNAKMAHPALGRLVFLLRPNGVRLHWLTDGDMEWTGLTDDLEVIDRTAQKSNTLPFMDSAWNKAELFLNGKTVQLHLNGQLVFEREHKNQLQSQFGFFHNRRTERLSVRDVVLSGNWPATFEEAVGNGLLEQIDVPASTERIYSVADIITAEEFNRRGYQVARNSESLPDAERFAALKRWVLPQNPSQPFRVVGGFMPSYFPNTTQSHSSSFDREPASLVSPALDLVSTAAGLGKLVELRREVHSVTQKSNSSVNTAAQLAILSAIATAQDDFDSANEYLDALFQLAKHGTERKQYQWWSELIGSWNAVRFPQTIDGGIRILDHITVDRLNKGVAADWQFANPVRAVRGLAHDRRKRAAGILRPFPTGSLWKPVTHATAETSALGIGNPWWAIHGNGEVVHHSGHREDFLYYDVPLRGDFVVTCELVPHGWQEARLMYADHWLGINYTGLEYEQGRVGFELRKTKFADKAMSLGQTYQCRMEMKDGVQRHWVNGTEIFKLKMTRDPDPWLAIRCDAATHNGVVRNLKIAGSPEIPTEIKPLQQANLQGWTASHFSNSMRYAGADWLRSRNEIVGVKRMAQKVTKKESLLRYHRPMLEDGEFEYTFSYSGTQHVHPSIGRTVFLLHADGVQEHILTNGIYGNENLLPDNRSVFASRQIDSKLSLKAFNNLKLQLKGNDVTLVLNRKPIYRKTLDTEDQRFFGFFHYSGETAARVSNVVYRGDWPRRLPPVSEQLLAGGVPELRVDTTDSAKFLQHSFEKNGLPKDLFSRRRNFRIGKGIEEVAGGIQMTMAAIKDWSASTLSPELSVHGDFDIEASFSRFSSTTPSDGTAAGVHLSVQLAGKNGDVVEVGRRIKTDGSQVVESMWVVNGEDGAKYRSTAQPEISSDGTFRISRRGTTMYWMFAPSDSDGFRILRTEKVSDEVVSVGNLDLKLLAAGDAELSAVWKTLTIRAEELSGL